jgi:hypothetical protein
MEHKYDTSFANKLRLGDASMGGAIESLVAKFDRHHLLGDVREYLQTGRINERLKASIIDDPATKQMMDVLFDACLESVRQASGVAGRGSGDLERLAMPSWRGRGADPGPG